MTAPDDSAAEPSLRRLGALARAALARYELGRTEVSFHGFETNVLYRVRVASGERFMLRLAEPGWRTRTDLRSEASWLAALARDTGVAAPRVVPTRAGATVVPLSVPGVPGTWHATLMTWVPGRLLGHYLTAGNLAKLGALFAELHQHGASWSPPAGFTRRRFEHWLSRGEVDLVTSRAEAATGGARAPSGPALPAAARDWLDRMDRLVEGAYAAIDRSDLRVIHCDLWHDNVKLHRGVLHPFDFEDTVWGFRAHDIAMAMLDLLETTGVDRYAGLLAAFRGGYEAHLAWPADPIEPFQIGRLLWTINWVARHEAHALARMVERHVPVFDHYVRTGEVALPADG